MVAVVLIDRVLHLRKPQLLHLAVFLLFPQFPLQLVKAIAHVGHLVVEIHQKHLLLLHGHKERQLKQLV